MKIQEQRQQFTSSIRKLRRARRLYMHLCANSVLASEDDEVLHLMIKRMFDCGLYSKPSGPICWRDKRYSIARYIFKIKTGGYPNGYRDPFAWPRWCRANGFDHNFSRYKEAA